MKKPPAIEASFDPDSEFPVGLHLTVEFAEYCVRALYSDVTTDREKILLLYLREALSRRDKKRRIHFNHGQALLELDKEITRREERDELTNAAKLLAGARNRKEASE